VLPRPLPERLPAPDGPPLLTSNPLPLVPWQRESTDGPGGQIGRYVVIKEIGSGGMGLVLSAYDADLERKVALKILRERARDGTAGAVRMRREAQAMARLSHPNVAQVYEVAEDRDGRLFLAMEFIEGQTLREWLTAAPRTWREVLKVYVEAGRGLAAAHAAGLMHRDFKPDNAMLATDGRVRVLDFGLSRSYTPDETPTSASSSGALQLLVTAAGSLVGTPAYMSPEQLSREEADARSDQFSFCVAVWEGLYGVRPFPARTVNELARKVRSGEITPPPPGTKVPAWVRRVLERGLTVDPGLRWPGLDALLAALEHDPQQRRRRWLAGTVAVVGIASVGYGAALYGAAQAEVCSGAADELVGVWDEERRAAVDAAIRGTGVAYADRAAGTIVAHLDAYATRWTAVHGASCTARQRGRMNTAQYERRTSCLRQRRSELAATATVLAQTTRDTVAQAIDTARGLPAVALCEDDERLMATAPAEDPAVATAVEEGRAKLARAHALERSGRYAEGLAEVVPLANTADALGYLPYRAEVHLLAGKLFMHEVKPEARGHFEDAVQSGLAADADALVAEGLALQMFQIGAVERRPLEAQVIEPLAWGFLRRIGDPPRLVALMHNSVGVVHYGFGQREQAVADYEAGLALLAEHVPDDPLALGGAYRTSRRRSRISVSTSAPVSWCERRSSSSRSSSATVIRSQRSCNSFWGRVTRPSVVQEAAVRSLEAAIACLSEAYPSYALLRARRLRRDVLAAWGHGAGAAADRACRSEKLLAQPTAARLWALEIDVLRADLDIVEGRLLEAARSLGESRVRAIEVFGATLATSSRGSMCGSGSSLIASRRTRRRWRICSGPSARSGRGFAARSAGCMHSRWRACCGRWGASRSVWPRWPTRRSRRTRRRGRCTPGRSRRSGRGGPRGEGRASGGLRGLVGGAGAPQDHEDDADDQQRVGDVEVRPAAAPRVVDFNKIDDAGSAELVEAEEAVVQIAEGAGEDHRGPDDARGSSGRRADQRGDPHGQHGDDRDQPPRRADLADHPERGALVVGEVQLEHAGPQDPRAARRRAQGGPRPLLGHQVEGERGGAHAREQGPAAGRGRGLLIF
jgi:predicted Ser/Thr protein kinase